MPKANQSAAAPIANPLPELSAMDRQEHRFFRQIAQTADRSLIADKFLEILENATEPAAVAHLLNALSNYEDELAALDRAQQASGEAAPAWNWSEATATPSRPSI